MRCDFSKHYSERVASTPVRRTPFHPAITALLILLLISAGLFAQDTSPEAPAATIHTDFAAAVEDSQAQKRPLLVIFGAEWCGWCQKLEAELETADIEPTLADWTLLKLDVDREPELAERLQASALPALRILGPFQSIVAARDGFLPADDLKQWLAEHRASADPANHAVLFDESAPDAAAVEKLIALLAEPSPQARAAAIDRLAAHSAASAPAVLHTLQTGRLIQQLATLEVLTRWQAPVDALDPWQPETLQPEKIKSLLEWAKQRLELAKPKAETAPPAASLRPDSASENAHRD